MRVGIVCYWFNRGQAVVGRYLRAACESLGHETFVLARPTRDSFTRPRFVDSTDVWDQSGVTAASHYKIPEEEYCQWAKACGLDVVLFDQNLQFPEIAALRRRGVRTIGRFVWESFGPDDIEGANAAFDTIYSLTACEQVRYGTFGIQSPRVRWGCPPDLDDATRTPRHDGEVRFLYPGGYLSGRKPTEETIEAFCGVADPRARLIIKAQHPVRGAELARRAPELDARIEVLVEDLPTEAHHQLLASVDVFLAPTRWEGLGLHMYEAIALGLPTITNDFPPMNEMVEHDVDGLLINARWSSERRPGVPKLETSTDELREAIERLCCDQTRARLARGVQKRRAGMAWSTTVEDIAALLAHHSGGSHT